MKDIQLFILHKDEYNDNYFVPATADDIRKAADKLEGRQTSEDGNDY